MDSKGNILIVDDEPSICTVICDYLRLQGYNCASANAVDSALQILQTVEGVDCILSDIKMPGKTGIDLLREVKTYWPEMAVILFTGNAEIHTAVASMQEGAYAAKAIRARISGTPPPPPFHYFNKGQLAVIGRGAAVADLGKLKVSGVIAWFIWLFVHLMYIVEYTSRVLIFIEWGFLYLTFNRGARLITGRDDLSQTTGTPEEDATPATQKGDTVFR